MSEGRERLTGRTILVAGATGFIGARVCLQAAAEGAQVRALSRSPRSKRFAGVRNIQTVCGDLLQPETLLAAFENHLDVVNAAYDFLESGAAQMRAFDNLLAAAKAANVRSFIQLSSIAVYDDWPNGALTEDRPADAPGSAYKMIKREFEKRLAESVLPHTILQPTIVYGSGGWQWTERPIEELSAGRVILPDNPRGHCHAVHVDDVAEAVICALAAPQRGRRYIISGPEPIEWGDLYAGYADVIGTDGPEFQSIDAEATDDPQPSPLALKVKKSARHLLGETRLAQLRKIVRRWIRGGAPAVTRPGGSMLELMRARGRCSIERARMEIGYEPRIGLVEGLRRIRSARNP